VALAGVCGLQTTRLSLGRSAAAELALGALRAEHRQLVVNVEVGTPFVDDPPSVTVCDLCSETGGASKS
jgi:hypothetical protein